jgi:2,4'-dihydroxyacetophenone dioxygenase
MNGTVKETDISQSALRRGATTASDTAKMNWVPWAMRGAYFKLLNADEATGRYTLLIKVDRDVIAPLHRHVGAVEAYLLEGSFYYRDEPDIKFEAGCYLLERGGAIHQPVSQDGAVMLALFHGPVEALDSSGNVVGSVDWKWHVDAWNEATESRKRVAAGR